jgi:hypothetical protein
VPGSGRGGSSSSACGDTGFSGNSGSGGGGGSDIGSGVFGVSGGSAVKRWTCVAYASAGATATAAAQRADWETAKHKQQDFIYGQMHQVCHFKKSAFVCCLLLLSVCCRCVFVCLCVFLGLCVGEAQRAGLYLRTNLPGKSCFLVFSWLQVFVVFLCVCLVSVVGVGNAQTAGFTKTY